MRKLALLACVVAFMGVSGCKHTVRGAGKDTQNAGKAIQNATH